MVESGQNTKKIPEDLRRLTVTSTPVNDPQVKRTRIDHDNSNNNSIVRISKHRKIREM